MGDLLERITVFCFGASYAVALGLELLYHFRPRPITRLLALGFGGAGLLAHTVFVFVQPLPLATPFGSLIFLGWILAAFYLYGSIHHDRVVWGLFVLPVLLVLTMLAGLASRSTEPAPSSLWDFRVWQGEGFWRMVHGWLILLAAVGVCVGFVASVMYLVQAQRLKAKLPPGKGLKLLNLERLEAMNRRSLLLAFPLLTVGLLMGVVLSLHTPQAAPSWNHPKLLSALGLWVVFALLMYLRYAVHVRGRQLALGTILAFGLLLVSLLTAHPDGGGGP